MQKSIDFDVVSEFYDLYTDTDYDLTFWLEVIQKSKSPALELMCGSGRIIKPALKAGLTLEGMDYSSELLAICEYKLHKAQLKTALYDYDARSFKINHQKYGLMFIAFQAISEVCSDVEKKRLFEGVHTHLVPNGQFYITAHNPEVSKQAIDDKPKHFGTYTLPGSKEQVEISGIYTLNPETNIVQGTQFYKCSINNEQTRLVELPVKFHLIEPGKLENLLASSGFCITERFGDYDKSPLTAQSPFCILGCTKA